MTMEHIFPKAVLQSSICTMRRGRAHPTKMEMAYGMSIYKTLKVTGKLRKKIVPANEIYELKREYHTSKSNPKFSRAITTIKGYAEKEPRPFYVVTYKWADGVDQRFDLPRHGNATKPTSRQYYRKDPTLFLKVDNLIGKGLSTDQVYDSIARAGASTVSEAIPGPKLIDNRKLLSKKET